MAQRLTAHSHVIRFSEFTLTPSSIFSLVLSLTGGFRTNILQPVPLFPFNDLHDQAHHGLITTGEHTPKQSRLDQTRPDNSGNTHKCRPLNCIRHGQTHVFCLVLCEAWQFRHNSWPIESAVEQRTQPVRTQNIALERGSSVTILSLVTGNTFTIVQSDTD